MSTIDLKTSDIKAILEDVKKSLDTATAEKLVKAAEESSPAEAPLDADGDHDGDEAPAASPSPAPDTAGASPDASAGPAPEAPAPGSADGSADPGADQGMSPEQLEAEYSALPDEVLEAHYLACKKALLARSAPAQAPASPAGSPPAPPMASPAPAMKAEPESKPGEVGAPNPKWDAVEREYYAHKLRLGATPEQTAYYHARRSKPSPPPEPTAKAEGKECEVPKTSAKQPIEPEVSLKSEMEALRAQNKELNEGIEGLAKALHTVIGKPVRKAITNATFVERTPGETKSDVKPLSKKEVQEATRPDLAKMSSKDRSKLLDFYEDKVAFDKIAHLLK